MSETTQTSEHESDSVTGLSRRSIFRAGGAGERAGRTGDAGGRGPARGARRPFPPDNILQEPKNSVTPAASIFAVAQTAEQLATTFYRHGSSTPRS